MSLFVRRSTRVFAGLIGAMLMYGPAQAATPGATGLACAGSVSASERLACRSGRSARRPVRGYRTVIAEVRPPLGDPTVYYRNLYASLLILGVAY